MHEPARVRRQHGTRDYQAFAALAARFPPYMLTDFETTSPDDLRDFDRSFARAGFESRRYLARNGIGRVVGTGHLFHIPWLPQPGCYWVMVRVDPVYQRHGIGRAIYRHIQSDLEQFGAASVQAMVSESLPEIVALVGRHGYREMLRTWPYTLDVTTAPALDVRPWLDSVEAGGLRVATLAALRANDDAWLPQLHALHMRLTGEIPLPEELFMTAEEFGAWVNDSPVALPEAYFVVLDGPRYVGQSFVQRHDEAPDVLRQEVTGVLPPYRGRGLAQALKALTIDYARRHCFRAIRTWVESNNPGMIAINLKFGFVRGPGNILFEKPEAGE
jgi:GNAT superfamily N-acetyltransferase